MPHFCERVVTRCERWCLVKCRSDCHSDISAELNENSETKVLIMHYFQSLSLPATHAIITGAPGVVGAICFTCRLSLSFAAENQSNTLTDKTENPVRVIKHHRAESLPGYPLFQEPLKISHGRTRSEPLTGDEVDRVLVEKGVTHSSCKAINGTTMDTAAKKTQWSRRASTGTRLHKLSPAHTKSMYFLGASIMSLRFF